MPGYPIEPDEKGRYIQVIDGRRQILRPTDVQMLEDVQAGGWDDKEVADLIEMYYLY